MATKTKAPAKRKTPAPAQDSTAFGPIAERFRRAGDHERAISLCREGLKKYPNHASARVTLGWALLETGKYDEAREELEAVLRRAPDNLAAIRGLAELHDRAEHTLNLPMDGPGQWPPPVDEQGAEGESKPAPKAAKAVAAADSSKHAPAVIAPAELGLAMWSPIAPAEAETAVEHAQPVEPAVPPQIAQPESAQQPVIIHTSQPRVVAEPAAAVQPPHAGMSSMRELDPGTGVVQIQASAPVAPPAPPSSASVAEAEDVDLAALLAEAEKLEAVAESSDDIPATVDLDAQIDLGEFNVGEVAPEPFEVGGAAATSTAFVASEPVAEPEPIAAAEPVAETEPTLVVEPIVAVETAVEPVAVIETQVEPVAEALIVAAEHVVIADPEPASEAALEPAAEPLAVAAFVAIAPEKPASTSKLQLIALERFLRQVQTRRLELVAESVA